MIDVKTGNLDGLVPRLLELTSRKTPWHRQLWRAGTLEVVREMLGEALIPGTRETALKHMRRHVEEVLSRDEGATTTKAQLLKNIKEFSNQPSGDDYFVQMAERYADELAKDYLPNWAQILEDEERCKSLNVEGTARRLISHLLYRGLPNATVYSFFNELENDQSRISISDALRQIDAREKRSPTYYTFAVPLVAAPSFLHYAAPENWLTAKDLKEWKHKHAPRAEKVRHHGGFLLRVSARDINEAADEAINQLTQLKFKFWAGSSNRFTISDVMWSEETKASFLTHHQKNNDALKIRAFERAETLHDLHLSAKTRNILAVMEPLRMDNAQVAIVNGWTALESLLVGSQEDDILGAERIATIVAASYFRTEMAWLAKNFVDSYSGTCPHASSIAAMDSSSERIRAMSELLESGERFPDLSAVDRLAIEKMRVALSAPLKYFNKTRELLTTEFRRLYRKRNLIVHSGKALDFGIETTAERMTPLIVNGVDQILIGEIQHDLDPIEFAAQVRFAADHLPASGGGRDYPLFELLGE